MEMNTKRQVSYCLFWHVVIPGHRESPWGDKLVLCGTILSIQVPYTTTMTIAIILTTVPHLLQRSARHGHCQQLLY